MGLACPRTPAIIKSSPKPTRTLAGPELGSLQLLTEAGSSVSRLYCTRAVVEEIDSPFRHLTRQIEQRSN